MNNYKIEIFFTAIASTVFAVLFFVQPAVVIDGIRKGLTICGSSVIPSLFPFMVLSDFVVRSGFGGIIGRKIFMLTEKVFRLPGTAGCAIIMGLIGGFPVGAKMTAQLFENGEINARQGRRMMIFCVNAGPAFVIGTVGAVMLSSRRAGAILFASMTLASLIAGITTRFLDSGKVEKCEEKIIEFNSGTITESVNCSVQAILNVCAWIILFSGLNEFIIRLPLSELTIVWFRMITEVTGGCLAASSKFPTCIIALVLGWSGLAVHCQLLPYMKVLGMRLSHLWVSRIVIGGLSTVIAYLLFRLFPCEVNVFSSVSRVMPEPYSVSAPVAAAMMVLSALMLTDIKLARTEKV